MTEEEVTRMNKHLLELIIDAGLPFSFSELPSFHRLVNSIRPGTSKVLPNCQKVASNLLSIAAKEAKDNMKGTVEKFFKRGHFGGLLVDGYKNVSGNHIESIMLSVNSNLFPLDVAKAGSDHHGIAVAKVIETEIIKYKDL
mmetsp:Transcript_3282/g.5012  ORF Transcript_3282/g.5012 Transcript_3282/m.5012 type:complete len:141 (+) Transcript_3282:675-1097(+)